MVLDGVRVIESSAFVAAPLAGLTLAQMGAEVIRCDPLRGGLDARRWPVTAEGRSLYWAGLNKGKRSLAVDTRTPEGQEIVAALIAAPGAGGGIFLTNLPQPPALGYEALARRRADTIMLQLSGLPDGGNAVDYTVNCAVGIPFTTGPERAGEAEPVNNALPAWDLVTGMQAALGIVAAERHRRLTGHGQRVTLALYDVALAMVGHLGYVADAAINGRDRPAVGNHVYGAYGSEFAAKDGRYVYVVAVTDRMWAELVKATGSAAAMDGIARARGLDLARREGDRFEARHAITAGLVPWFRARTAEEIAAAFKGTGVCWGPYRAVTRMLAEDPRASAANPMMGVVDQPGIGAYPAPGLPLDFGAAPRLKPAPAPRLGEDTDEILSTILGMSRHEIARLRDAKVVAGPVEV